MTKRNVTVSNVIREILKENKKLDYNKLLEKTTKIYNNFNNVGQNTKKLNISEYNERLKNFVKRKQIGYYFDFNMEFDEYTHRGNIPKDKVRCYLYWIDNSVHSKLIHNIIKAIKKDYGRNIIKIIDTVNMKDYILSKIKIVNNEVNIIDIDIYDFRNKINSFKLYNEISELSSDTPYHIVSTNRKYKLKLFILFNTKHLNGQNINSSYIGHNLAFVNVNNFVIKFKMTQNDSEYLLKLIDVVVNSISKKLI